MARNGFSFSEDCGYAVKEVNTRFCVYHVWKDAGGSKHQTMLTRGYKTREAAEKAAEFYRTRQT